MTGALILALMLLPSARAQQPPPEVVADTPRIAEADTMPVSGPRPRLTIRPKAEPIRIDGDLDDEGWEAAARVTGFTEFRPRPGAEPPVPTEVWITYDERHLYVAFIAHGDPREIRASHRERGQIWDDDFVGVILDTYGDANQALMVLSNPYGVQGDLLLLPGGGEDDRFDVLYQSAGRITETGYQVELAVPFTSLRFPDREVQHWRINFWRNLPRSSRHQLSWVPLDLDDPCLLCQTADLAGLEGIRPGGAGVELLPALVASQASALRSSGDPAAGFEHGGVQTQASLGAKYVLPSGWTLEATYNPDFSQVESDAAQVDVNTTFALFFPERRPFFQEGSDLFDTWVTVAYTRSINSPRFAGKITGRAGRTSIAYLAARDQHTPFVIPFQQRSAIVQAARSTSNVLRVRHGIGEDAFIGVLFTDRRLDRGGSGTNVSADARIRFGQSYVLSAQVVGSYTVELDDPELTVGLAGEEFGRGDRRYTAAFDGESFAGVSSYLTFARWARAWSFELLYRDASPTYRADSGFATRNDFRRVSGWSGYTFYLDDGWFEQVRPSLNASVRWDYDGSRLDRQVNPGLRLGLKRQTWVNLSASLGSERFRGIEFDGIRRASIWVDSEFSDPLRLGFSASHGRSIARALATPVLGTGTDLSVFGMLKPVARITIRPSWSYSRLEHPETGEAIFAGYILRTRMDYQFNRELSLRLVAQYDDFGQQLRFEPLVTYRLNPLSIFYIGSTQEYHDFEEPSGFAPTRRQYFAKFQYMLRV